MTFWLIIGAMTAAAVLAVLVPLLRPRMVMRARESSRDAGKQVGLLAPGGLRRGARPMYY